MLKSSLVFKRNGAHLVEKKIEKTSIVFWTCILNKHDYQGLSALNMQFFFWFVSSFEHVNLQLMENIPKKLWQSKLLCFTCDISNKKKCCFKEKSIHLGGFFDYAFTHMLLTFGAINFKPSEYKKSTRIWFKIIIIFLATLSKWIL
jgi:hypothetical protein